MKSLRFNHIEWEIMELGDTALILRPRTEEAPLPQIQKLSRTLKNLDVPELSDVIPAYKDLTLVFDAVPKDPEKVLDALITQLKTLPDKVEEQQTQKIKVPVCYALGTDWEAVTSYTGMSREEVIKKHMEAEYMVAMMGFVPGFLYLSGMDESIRCPRKEQPRTRVPSGAVGIAGTQTGIYSLESPGGWQIIGRTPLSFFNAQRVPPNRLEAGDRLTFFSITEEEFEHFREEWDG